MAKKFSEPERLKLALASFNEGIVVTKYCAKHGVSRSALYRFRKELLVRLADLPREK